MLPLFVALARLRFDQLLDFGWKAQLSLGVARNPSGTTLSFRTSLMSSASGCKGQQRQGGNGRLKKIIA